MKTTATVTVHIRWLILRDVREVLAIEALSWPDPWTEDDFLACLRQRNCIGMVAEVGEKIVGYMVYEIFVSRLRLFKLAVDPQYRRRGIGQQMVDKLTSKLVGQLAGHRRTRITADVPETNMDALLFLRAHGFEATRVMRDFFETEDGIRMVFQIPAEASSDQEDGE